MIHHRTTGIPAAVVLVAALAGEAAVGVQQPTPGSQVVFRSQVDMVRVDARVVRDQSVVAGLQPADFELRDNGVLQKIVGASAEQIPLDTMLALDLSGSLSEHNAALLRGAASHFLDGLAPKDRAGLLVFNARPVLVTPFTGDLELIRKPLATIRGAGNTALNDAVYAALRCGEPGEMRGAVVVFTDGVDNMSWLSADEVVEVAKRSNTIVYTVATGVPGIAYRAEDSLLLRDLARETGGQVWSASWAELAGAFRAVLNDLRSRYLLTYYPAGVSPAGWHALEVKVRRGGAKVTARTGYYRSLPPSKR